VLLIGYVPASVDTSFVFSRSVAFFSTFFVVVDDGVTSSGK